mmetsp:Transcript_71252/g.206632  ORF Transcript_71252/g.206632 Transcript_71252/m.206632 type:complete len:402 (-) Transcript_71252:160-1365(-)
MVRSTRVEAPPCSSNIRRSREPPTLGNTRARSSKFQRQAGPLQNPLPKAASRKSKSTAKAASKAKFKLRNVVRLPCEPSSASSVSTPSRITLAVTMAEVSRSYLGLRTKSRPPLARQRRKASAMKGSKPRQTIRSIRRKRCRLRLRVGFALSTRNRPLACACCGLEQVSPLHIVSSAHSERISSGVAGMLGIGLGLLVLHIAPWPTGLSSLGDCGWLRGEHKVDALACKAPGPGVHVVMADSAALETCFAGREGKVVGVAASPAVCKDSTGTSQESAGPMTSSGAELALMPNGIARCPTEYFEMRRAAGKPMPNCGTEWPVTPAAIFCSRRFWPRMSVLSRWLIICIIPQISASSLASAAAHVAANLPSPSGESRESWHTMFCSVWSDWLSDDASAARGSC